MRNSSAANSRAAVWHVQGLACHATENDSETDNLGLLEIAPWVMPQEGMRVQGTLPQSELSRQ
eukprot:4511233-Amphidinium_carterae.1